jgi:hypothetical protein
MKPKRKPMPTLAQALDQARHDLNQQRPPAGLLAQVQAALPATPPAAPRRLRRWASTASFAVPGLAAIGCLVWALQLPLSTSSPPGPLRAQALAGFVPVAAAQSWPQDSTPAWLINTELRRDRLALLGLPFDPGRAGDSVRAELLVRASGEVLAVRLLP